MTRENVKEYFKPNGLQLLLSILGLIMLILATYITVRLAPLSQDLAVVTQRVSANEDLDRQQNQTFVSKDEFNQVITQLNRLEGKVDSLSISFR